MTEHNGIEKADATVEDVAEHFNVSTRTIRRWIAEHGMPHRKGGGDNGALRFNLSEVDAWAARGGRKGAA